MKCPYCGDWAELVGGDVIYPRRPDLAAKKFWRCAACDAYVGCHGLTSVPLGRLANKDLREAKKKAHAAFDPIWKGGTLTRKAAYSWLAKMMGIPSENAHIGMFNEAQCRQVVGICMNKPPKVML